MIRYHSHKQIPLAEFDGSFQTALDENNRGVKMSECMPWDALAAGYYQGLSDTQGRPTKNARLVIGVVLIKHKLCLSDRAAVLQIQENPYLQYFVGLSVEGKFGQGKNGYRLNYIRAKRTDTATAWINSIFLVMNLLILLRIFFALCKKGVTVVLLPLLRIEQVLFCHQRAQLVSHCVLCQTTVA